MEENKIKLSHTVLYAKGWYEKSDNIIEDLIVTLKLDDYTAFTKRDVCIIIINEFHRKKKHFDLIHFLKDIHPSRVDMIGYPNNIEYDLHLATLYYVLSYFKFLDKDQWERKTPKYRKNSKLKKPKHISTKYVIDMFNNLNKKK
jgi:hypothetical protein